MKSYSKSRKLVLATLASSSFVGISQNYLVSFSCQIASTQSLQGAPDHHHFGPKTMAKTLVVKVVFSDVMEDPMRKLTNFVADKFSV